MRGLAARAVAVIRIDAIWLASAPVDMRAGADRLLAAVVQVFGAAQPHHAYLFGNARATRIKVLIHDGQGIWLACRRLNQGHFKSLHDDANPSLTHEQFQALVLELAWRHLADGGVIRCV